ncbi:MAG: RecQ family ATP-dependent DNA helicase [Bacteroidales bacterium]|nr:RecQ family ATP-dependent DNA helicase [Bacteroidales bacterium]
MNIYQQILTKYWGHPNFRTLQDDIIKSVGNGNDTLGLMTTGGGKSITFQVPALAKDGLCLVITPLIALMKDQVANLVTRGIKAIMVYSGMTKNEIDVALENCIYGDYKFLYLSPERIGSELFKIRVQKMKVNLVAIDEAHCISQWGYDFRPSYLKIAKLRDLLPDVPFLALTATATPEVVEDIQEKLLFRKKNVLKTSYERKNLVYIVREVEDKQKYLLKIISNVKGSGIVYVRTRRKSKEIKDFLNNNQISAEHYHAGLSNKIRTQKQTDWTIGKLRVMVATNAFGMGIDKADVRFVVHFDLPDSLEAYFQEAGRAGRDGKRAYAVLLFNSADEKKLDQQVKSNFPEISQIKRVYEALGNYFQIPVGSGKNGVFDFNIADFSSKYKFNLVNAYNSLKFLGREGYLELTEEINNPSKVHFLLDRDDLYKFQVANVKFDGFIKLLLRSYTGIFTEYVSINERSLAQNANVHIDIVYQYLSKLNNMKIIRYIPQKKTPLIIFTEERLDQKSLFISKENYKKRKECFVLRMQSVIDYATNQDLCRSQVLLSYFGEKDSNPCGKCDVCKKGSKLKLGKQEFNSIMDNIKTLLCEEALLLDQLVDRIKFDEDKTLKVIQWLFDNDTIYYQQDDRIAWKI